MFLLFGWRSERFGWRSERSLSRRACVRAGRRLSNSGGRPLFPMCFQFALRRLHMNGAPARPRRPLSRATSSTRTRELGQYAQRLPYDERKRPYAVACPCAEKRAKGKPAQDGTLAITSSIHKYQKIDMAVIVRDEVGYGGNRRVIGNLSFALSRVVVRVVAFVRVVARAHSGGFIGTTRALESCGGFCSARPFWPASNARRPQQKRTKCQNAHPG